MFPLSHIYIATKVAARENDLLVLGSVIPDLAWFSVPLKGVLHDQPDEFWDFVKEKFPDFSDLALGVKLHSQVNKGADYYSDDEEVGFAKINGRKILKDAAMTFEIEEGHQALILSHNFIEVAIDLHLGKKFPSIVRLYKKAIGSVMTEGVARILSAYSGKEISIIGDELKKFFAFFSPENISIRMGVCSNAVVPYLEKILHKKLNFNQILGVLDQSVALTKESSLPFLDETVNKMKVDFKNLI